MLRVESGGSVKEINEINGLGESSVSEKSVRPRAESAGIVHDTPMASWTILQVSEWLLSNNLGSFVEPFAKNKIAGICLVHVNDGDLDKMGVAAEVLRCVCLTRVAPCVCFRMLA